MHSKKEQDRGDINKLCIDCRRNCKQAATSVVASCPRYYPFGQKKIKQSRTWQQQELHLF